MKDKIPSWNKWRDIMTHIIILQLSLRKNGFQFYFPELKSSQVSMDG